MTQNKDSVLKKLSEIEKRLAELETYVYNLDDFLPARSLVEKVMTYIAKKDKINALDLEKRFRVNSIRAQKLIELFISYEMLSIEKDKEGYYSIDKEAFGIIEHKPVSSDETDPLLPEVIKILKDVPTASASLFQRKFNLGYARAARIIDILEQRGFVGPAIGSKPREVLKK